MKKKRTTHKEPVTAPVQIVTIDCISAKDYYNEYCFRDGRYHRHILEIKESLWIEELRKSLTDVSATFLNYAKHYVLPLQEIVIEFIANKLEIAKVV